MQSIWKQREKQIDKVINNAINTGLERWRAIRAIKNAIGIAITAQITVTLIATNNVRIVTLK